MTLVPLKAYIDSSLKYANENPLGTMRRVFVSSEDPNVIEESKKLPILEAAKGTAAGDTRWQVYTSDIPRLNSGPKQQV